MIDPKIFRQVRKALGLTQEELADAIGLSRVTINKMERGRLRRGIPDEIAERLMALKPRGSLPPIETFPERFEQSVEFVKKMRQAAKDATVKSDDHLWDNEEEDES